MLGDTAVAVHPDDERYRSLVGKFVDLPLTGRKIPIIADAYVDPEFGSGCVKITPAHDFNDYQVWTRHRDSDAMSRQTHGGLINVFDDNAAIRENVNNDELSEGELIPPKFVGMSREDARKQVVRDFESANLLEKVEDHQLKIPRGDRSNAIVEPYLTNQWYVDLTKEVQQDGRPGGKAVITDPLYRLCGTAASNLCQAIGARPIISGWKILKIGVFPGKYGGGHRIPAWYDEDGTPYVAESEEAVREKYHLPADLPLSQDEDVLDTWFSSALWPFSTLGWPDERIGLTRSIPPAYW